MLYKKWVVGQPDEQKSEELARQTGVGSLLSRVLVSRGIDTPEAVAELLQDDLSLPDPFSLQDMDRAVQRIHKALQQDEAIVIFGDYDVDGITSTALLYSYLESQGARVFYKLPNRNDDDYGLTEKVVETAAGREVGLIITVDNGTTAFPAVKRAAELGIDIVVTDHHLPQGDLPQVAAVVNPCRADDDSDCACFSGVGVAFMLVCALEECAPEELLPVFSDLVAIGTVADVMRLCGPNRILVKNGLAAIRNTSRPGLAALLESCSLSEKDVTVENISYILAPRLNAAGRMDDATLALRLFLTEDPEEAEALVGVLEEQNAARQKAEQEMVAAITAQVDSDPELQQARVLVVWGEGWHQGVVGIVSSRLVDKYAKPAIVISFDGDEGKGSGRSVRGFSLHGAIASCADMLIRFGGHDLAAGLSVCRANVAELRRRVNQWAADHVPVMPAPEVTADTCINLDTLTLEQVVDMERLAPCGSGNPAARFCLPGAVLEAVYPVSEGRHCRLRLRQKDQSLSAVLFGIGPDALAYKPGDLLDVLLSLSIYEGRYEPQISARILELRPAGMENVHVEQVTLFDSFTFGGGLWEQNRELLTPTREDSVEVYREIRDGEYHEGDLRPLFAKLGEGCTGRILTSLAAFEELGLVQVSQGDGRYRPVKVAEKRDLATSGVMQKLGVQR